MRRTGILAMAMAGLAGVAAEGRTVERFDGGWRFMLGDPPAALGEAFDDSAWTPVRLPHDWSIGLSFTTNDAGGCTAFLPGGVGWYRKAFVVPEKSRGKVVRVDFDGVYNNAEVWINDHFLGFHPYGYTPFAFELSAHLRYGATNVLAVRVDRSAYMDCRWYPGSGIYREVKLVTHAPVHLQRHGLAVATRGNREVDLSAVLVNRTDAPRTVSVSMDLQEESGRSVGFRSMEVVLAARETRTVDQRFELAHPVLWDTDHPHLYRAEVELSAAGEVQDRDAAAFGVRDVRFDPEQGFFLNGRNMKIKGVCLHHDGGCVGAAVPDGVWERRLRLLKEAGCNAIRTAHNPPSEAFLDLCDRMGFLVQDEAFDEWFNPKDKKYNFGQKVADDRTRGYSEHFGEWAERDAKAMVLRDRNHPCVVMWSIGNEIEWTYPGYGDATGYWVKTNNASYYWNEPPYDTPKMKAIFAKADQGPHILAEQAADLSRWIREVDSTRAVTANLVMPSISHFSGYADALDIVGYSYRTVNYDWGHRNYPGKMILGTENWVQWAEWKAVLERPFIPGLFLWTGIDYLGESTEWPRRSTPCGMLSTAGFRKPTYWLFKSLWREDEPMVHFATQPLAESNYRLQDGRIDGDPARPRDRTWYWPSLVEHWNYRAGELVYVEGYSNCEEVELLLDGRSLGVRRLAECPDRLMQWVVPHAPGILMAVGRNDGREVAEYRLATAGAPVAVRLEFDKERLMGNGRDVAHCVARLVDADGNPVRHEERTIRFAVDGAGRNIGVDNGSSTSVQDFQADTCRTDQGRCLLVVQADAVPGLIEVAASADGLAPARIVLNVE